MAGHPPPQRRESHELATDLDRPICEPLARRVLTCGGRQDKWFARVRLGVGDEPDGVAVRRHKLRTLKAGVVDQIIAQGSAMRLTLSVVAATAFDEASVVRVQTGCRRYVTVVLRGRPPAG